MEQYVLPGMERYFTYEQRELDFTPVSRPRRPRFALGVLLALASTTIDKDYVKMRRAEDPNDIGLEALAALLEGEKDR